ncbi:MAG: transporter [Prevotella sp.]|jgi:BASS family bile acid:Na+ symporter
MSALIKFFKQWTLLVSLIVGSSVYLLFSRTPVLQPVGDFLGPKLVQIMPVVIFCILYVTFCKIQLTELRPRRWHFILQLIRTALSALMVLLVAITPQPELRLLFEGMFVCFICPTAAAAAVITDKLGGSIASMTVYILIANCFTSVIIPLFFPLVEKNSDITFLMAFFMVLRRVFVVLIVPLFLAWFTRHYLPKLAQKIREKRNLGFYLWSFNLSIVMGLAMQSLTHAPVSGYMLVLMCVVPLLICLFQFSVGKAVGAHYGDSVTAGQALGQKNTVVGIWLTISFLNPYAAIAPCSYVIWQNIVNAIQLYIKEKYGKLKW